MKHLNCKDDCIIERNEYLLRQFRQFCNESEIIVTSQIHMRIAQSPAPRFWVSEWRAAIVIADLFNGRTSLASMRPCLREMYTEIFRRAKAIRQHDPSASFISMASTIVTQQAPSHYLTPLSIGVIINRYKRELRRNRKH